MKIKDFLLKLERPHHTEYVVVMGDTCIVQAHLCDATGTLRLIPERSMIEVIDVEEILENASDLDAAKRELGTRTR